MLCKHYSVVIGKPIINLCLSKSPSLISVSNDDINNNDNMIDNMIGCSAGWQAPTQQIREQIRMTNRVELRLRFSISIRNGNGNRDDTNIRADSAPFLPSWCLLLPR